MAKVQAPIRRKPGRPPSNRVRAPNVIRDVHLRLDAPHWNTLQALAVELGGVSQAVMALLDAFVASTNEPEVVNE